MANICWMVRNPKKEAMCKKSLGMLGKAWVWQELFAWVCFFICVMDVHICQGKHRYTYVSLRRPHMHHRYTCASSYVSWRRAHACQGKNAQEYGMQGMHPCKKWNKKHAIKACAKYAIKACMGMHKQPLTCTLSYMLKSPHTYMHMNHLQTYHYV